MKRLLAIPVVFVAACGPTMAPTPPVVAPTPVPAPAAQAPAPRMEPSIHWTRTSAEHRAVFLQTYRDAGEDLRALAAGAAAGSWAVILDADETVLDNSTYQRRQAERGAAYSDETWNAWVREEAAPALPGAVEFVRQARELGGRVVIVTNRNEEVCEPTRRNLARVGVQADAVLCRQDTSDKNPRFRAVEAGTAGLPPARVLMWVGDNIQDFPELTQAVRTQGDAAFERFGRTFVILPNPMYGSWERNPPQ